MTKLTLVVREAGTRHANDVGERVVVYRSTPAAALEEMERSLSHTARFQSAWTEGPNPRVRNDDPDDEITVDLRDPNWHNVLKPKRSKKRRKAK